MTTVSQSTGKYAPPATQFPITAAYCGMPAADSTALLRKMRPKSSSSGKISSCSGRNTPDESTRYTIGSRNSDAIRCARRNFFTDCGNIAPALTVASFAITTQGRPLMRPIPMTTPAAGTSPHSGYIPHAAHRPSSKNVVSGSSNSATRSRAVSRLSFRCRATPAAPPPSRSCCSCCSRSRSNSRCVDTSSTPQWQRISN